MCDDDIHVGLISDPAVTRRTFGVLTAAAAGLAAAPAAGQARVRERDVEVKTPDGLADAVLFHPEGRGSWPGVLIWTDVVGLRPVFREMGRRLAASGYVVLVPNPYYRVRRAPVVDGAFNFADPADRAKLGPFRASLTPEGVDRDAAAYVDFLDAQPQTRKAARIGVQGYCMGGPLTLRTAAARPDRVGAGASFHGGGLVTAEPSSPHLLIPKMQGEYLIAIADNDHKARPGDQDALIAAFKAAGRPATVEVYEGAAHGWCVRGSAVYNEPAAERAWAQLLALYGRALV